MRTPVLGLLATLVLVGCSKEGYKPQPVAKIAPPKVQQGKEGSLFPFDKGTQWTYMINAMLVVNRQQRPAEPQEQTYRVVEAGPDGKGGWRATIEVLQADANGKLKVQNRQQWLTTSKGIYQLSVRGKQEVAYNPPMPAVIFPAKTGQKFTWKGTGVQPDGQVGTHTVKSRVLGPQEVDTLAGRRSAIAVESETSFGSGKTAGKAVSKVWFQPNVGIVRYTQKMAKGNAGLVVQLQLKKHFSKAPKKAAAK